MQKYKIGIEVNEIRYEEFVLEAETEMKALELARDQGIGKISSAQVREIKMIRKRELVK